VSKFIQLVLTIPVWGTRPKPEVKEKKKSLSKIVPAEPTDTANDLLDTTVVEGKTIGAWAAIIQAREEKAAAEVERDERRTGVKKLVLVDVCDLGTISQVVTRWRSKGAPTALSREIDAVNVLKEKAEKLKNDARTLELDAQLKSEKDPAKKRAQAKEKREKAATLEAEASQRVAALKQRQAA
jgi:hypothetical protein